jgi:hypothetical protein
MRFRKGRAEFVLTRDGLAPRRRMEPEKVEVVEEED